MKKKQAIEIFILIGLAYIYLMFGNGVVSLTNPDEVFYTQTAKEMIQNKTWMTPYLFGAPQFEKPIFLYWAMRISIGIFGDTSFAARFSPALFAILGAIAVYFLALIGFKNERKAFVTGLMLISSGFYIGLSRSVFTDMIFSVFILFALLSFYWGYTYPARKGPGIMLFFLTSALATLTKGPLGLIIPLSIAAVFLFVKKDLKFMFCKYSIWGLLLFLAVSLPWYLLMEIKYGSTFNREFFYNDHFVRIVKAEHIENDKWYFYPFTMLGTVFPWSLYTLTGLFLLFKHIKRHANNLNIFLAIWISAVLLIFQFAHSKLTSYIFPLYPALIIIAGDYIYSGISGQNKGKLFYFISLIMAIAILLFPLALVAFIPKFSVYLSSKTPVYALALSLFISGVFSLIFVLRKKFLSFVLTLVSLLLIVLFGSSLLSNDIEPFVSSKQASEYLIKNYPVSGPIICSKFYARGVRYYTNKEIVVVDIPGTNYFSPHPVPFLNTHQKVRDFMSKYPVNYGILKKGNVRDFESLTAGHYKFEVLKQIGNEYVVRISSL
ncbi:MAG: glycosyltransferase family 39 protein [Candidatus Omnitrophica bacterium]|nr:glycosyltransferase family 39 protein [Candidatus Omnitrophota bacterium]